jgi:crossover junction endodeoxyribonuclease RuvC
MSKILGIDPGIATTGFGIIQKQGNKIKAIDYGKIITTPKDKAPDRLKIIYKELKTIIKKHKPDVIAIEQLFFNKNTKTALTVGQARGIAMLSAANFNIPLYEYTPLQVKSAVVGYGRADKNQIKYMVKVLLNLKEAPTPDDTADSLAIAICHINSNNKLLCN